MPYYILDPATESFVRGPYYDEDQAKEQKRMAEATLGLGNLRVAHL